MFICEKLLMEEVLFLDLVLDILLDAVKDTLYLIPFLLVTYIAMEWLEHGASRKFQEAIERGGAVGPAIGAVLGVVPQCGFSAAASTFYAARVITLGTLIAVFLSTSDEMLPIFIAEAVPAQTIAAILVAKIVIGLVAGFFIDAVMRVTRPVRESWRIHELCERAGCHCDDDDASCIENAVAIVSAQEAASAAASADASRGVGDGLSRAEGHGATELGRDHDHGHNHAHGRKHTSWGTIVRSAVKHTVEVSCFVFLIVLAMNAVFALFGEDALATVLSANSQIAVVVSGLVGLIPNCAASVAIAQLYVDGVLGSGAMMSGLLCAAGVGLLVLFRTNASAKQNIAILAMLLAVSCASGLLIDALGIVF